MPKKPVLWDHKPSGKLLRTPLNAAFPSAEDVSWILRGIPEFIWLGLLYRDYGFRRTVQIAARVSRAVSTAGDDADSEVAVGASKFDALSDSQFEAMTKRLICDSTLDSVIRALRPMLVIYSGCPFSRLLPCADQTPEDHDFERMAETIAEMTDQRSKLAMCCQAAVVGVAFDSGRIKTVGRLKLSRWTEIEGYPDADGSVEVGAMVRAGVIMLMGCGLVSTPQSEWPFRFWNRGHELSSCSFAE